MATSRMRSAWHPCRLQIVLLAIACWPALGLVDRGVARGESIRSSDFKIEIGMNMTWIDNRLDPYVGLNVRRMTPFERSILGSKPYVRVTNQSQGGQIQSFQLNLQKQPGTAVTGIVFSADQQGSQWKWLEDYKTVVVDFANPVDSGDSVTFRVLTGPSKSNPDLYRLQQDFFCPVADDSLDPRFTADGWGVIGLSVYDARQAGGNSVRSLSPLLAAGPVNSTDEFTYNLDRAVVDPYKSADQVLGVYIAAVPEPSGLALLVTAGVVAALVQRAKNRRRAA